MNNALSTTEDADFAVSQVNTPPSQVGKSVGSVSLAVLLTARPKLTAALVKAQQHCTAVTHDARNKFHGYDYTSSEAIIEAAKGALALAELAIIPVEQSIDGHQREGPERFELVRVFVLSHSSGESIPITLRWPICPEKGRPLDKAAAAADTLSLAYWLRDLLLMPRVDRTEEVAGRDDRAYQPRQNQQPRPAPTPAPPKLTMRERLQKKDAELTAAGTCASGELFNFVCLQVKVMGYSINPDTWGPAEEKVAADAVKRFIEERKAASEPVHVNRPAAPVDPEEPPSDTVRTLTLEQVRQVEKALANYPVERFCEECGVTSLDEIPENQFRDVIDAAAMRGKKGGRSKAGAR